MKPSLPTSALKTPPPANTQSGQKSGRQAPLLAPPVKKDNDPWAGTNTHWLMNTGFGLYTAASLGKRFSNTLRSFGHNNPTGLSANLGGTVANVALNVHRDMFSKYLLQITNSMGGLSVRTKNYNTNMNLIDTASNRATPSVGLLDMKDWLTTGYLKRGISGTWSRDDFQHAKEFGQFVGKEFTLGVKHFNEVATSFAQVVPEVGKSLVSPNRLFKLPKGLNMVMHEDMTPKQKRLIAANNFVYDHGIITGSTLAITADFASQLLGIHHIAKLVTVPALIAGEVALTWGKVAETSNLWNFSATKQVMKDGKPVLKNGEKVFEKIKRPWYFRPTAAGRGIAAVLAGTGNTFWAQDGMLGLLRLAAVFRAPYDIFHDSFTVDKVGHVIKPKKGDQGYRLSNLTKGTRGLWFMADVLAASAILSVPFVQRYEKKHHTTTNPLDRRSMWYKLDE